MGLQGSKNIKIAILTPNRKDSPSETFIRAHINSIQGDIHFLYGGLIPAFNSKSERISVHY